MFMMQASTPAVRVQDVAIADEPPLGTRRPSRAGRASASSGGSDSTLTRSASPAPTTGDLRSAGTPRSGLHPRGDGHASSRGVAACVEGNV